MKKKHIKVTADYVIDEYLAAKKLKGSEKTLAMNRVKYLSTKLNHFVDEEAQKSK